MSDSVAGRLGSLVSQLGSGPMFVHSDPFRTARLVPRSRDRAGLLDSHVELLVDAADGRGLWLPSFNYDFPRTHRFDMANDPCQLGPLPEHFRQTAEEWRTPVPIFSVSGAGANPGIRWGEMTDPFGPESIFGRLYDQDGVVVYYGETFHYNTIVHFAERKTGGPLYRYDKIFRGVVVKESGKEIAGSLNYHVRPMGTGLDYDWTRLLSGAIDAGVCVRLDGNPEVLAASARALTDHWVDSLAADPFSLLDDTTQAWTRLAYEKSRRRFTIDDFESQSG